MSKMYGRNLVGIESSSGSEIDPKMFYCERPSKVGQIKADKIVNLSLKILNTGPLYFVTSDLVWNRHTQPKW